MEPAFLDEIKKKTSLVKFVVNTDTATDIIAYLYKETEKQRLEIDDLKKKLGEINTNNNNQDNFNQLSERINELSIQINKKVDESFTKASNLINEKIKDIDMKTDSLSKKIGFGDYSSQSALADFYNQLKILHEEIKNLRKNTSEFLGIEEKDLSKSNRVDEKFFNRISNTKDKNQNPDSEIASNIANDAKNTGFSPIPISSSNTNSTSTNKERFSLQEISDQIRQLRDEINQIKETNIKSNSSTEANSNKSSSRVSSRLKKKEKDIFPKEKKIFKNQEVEVKIQSNLENLITNHQAESEDKKEEEQKIKPGILKVTAKIEDITSLQQEIEKLKQIVEDQTDQLKKIVTTSKSGQVSLDDYVQEILQSAMKCDSESEKLTNDYKNLQNLLINSLQEIKERMDSMYDQFNDMATKEEVMAAFSEVISPRNTQKGTSIGVSKCKCLACGRTKPSVITTTDSNLAEILHYHPLNSKNEIFRPGAKVTLLNKEIPVTSRTQIMSKEVMTPRRSKSSRS